MINVCRAKDVGSESVAVSQGNDSIPFKQRVCKKCTSPRFFDMTGGQSRYLGSQAGPL
jgi:hypothetical protein